MRIDKLLWFLRLVKTRGAAQEWVEAGHIRRNGTRIERCSASVAVGDVLVLPVPSGVRIIRLIAMPNRRGPANEAQSCYEALDETAPSPLAAGKVCSSSKGDLQP
ncbi:RNA-binding S4 domain-containing protein [Novosphingobium humi]|uniref:RNA-binding S4 domain-containing protein n=1 Tax=Novosphingobium humi TaxID=2282397 RepID=A0ABY7TW26_9SPHN|nr:RNA-binding S4 domain-containing protein [Novosphingobium humi]WCT77434.1 RNA-binding S4 domain-containing protein [Novosphingobium humi]